MPIASRLRLIDQADTDSLLEYGSARNLSIGLRVTDAEGSVYEARARLLGMDDRFLFLDTPQAAGRRVKLEFQQTMPANILINGARYEFETAVASLRCLVRLNDQKVVVGLVVTRPKNLADGQRRQDFRAPLRPEDVDDLVVHGCDDEEHGTTRLKIPMLRAKLRDVSLGGACLLIDPRDEKLLATLPTLFVGFDVPESDERMVFLCKVRQKRMVRSRAAVRIGVEFLPWPDARIHSLNRHTLQRVISRVQRARLRRAG